MRIGIVGSGNIGGTLARLWAAAGHDVALSNSRGPESLAALVEEIGPRARAATVDEAIAFGDVVVLAIPYGKFELLPSAPAAGKVLVDAMNYYVRRDGEIDLGDFTQSERVARHFPGGRLTKAFNTIGARVLAAEGRPSAPVTERQVVFVAGDDAEAKRTVERLIEDIGFAPVDTGSLREGGRKQQPGSPIYVKPMTAAEAQELLAAGW